MKLTSVWCCLKLGFPCVRSLNSPNTVASSKSADQMNLSFNSRLVDHSSGIRYQTAHRATWKIKCNACKEPRQNIFYAARTAQQARAAYLSVGALLTQRRRNTPPPLGHKRSIQHNHCKQLANMAAPMHDPIWWPLSATANISALLWSVLHLVAIIRTGHYGGFLTSASTLINVLVFFKVSTSLPSGHFTYVAVHFHDLLYAWGFNERWCYSFFHSQHHTFRCLNANCSGSQLNGKTAVFFSLSVSLGVGFMWRE